ncbi:UDP-galactose-lipid carrier transferase [bacterium]|nr:UDP-galactose-lipid carrier transferase [bacterium]
MIRAPQIEDLDLSLSYKTKDEYEKDLKKAQFEILILQQKIRELGIPVVMALEGVDAAGKGGAIKRLTAKLDPRGFNVIPVGAPTPIELAHHYLWRFWSELPRGGRITVFDRSWYGRVLVERVEKFASKGDWKRAYDEINAFEKSLVDNGHVVCKFWLQISKKEQLKRFREREKNPFKRWKITEDDWRNRKKWKEYQAAAQDMFDRTSTEAAPWTLVEAEHKWYSRVKVVRTVVKAIEKAVEGRS